MQIKLSLRQWSLSTLVFGGVLIALTSVDARVRERVTDVVTGGDGLTPWGDRLYAVQVVDKGDRCRIARHRPTARLSVRPRTRGGYYDTRS